ncbi:alpha-1,2 glucosyltransferase [Histoplasma capsulatum H143]|uniref:Dol-P-Glc:Glc(2)Man(9)GlcNAc(2)-PP-Dol alpha-1,2-glucosyltransferase n=1 Tax=Ajellomyces capsulatus (strain H143) TaxID=544712 RepID=C6H8G6_AJECH|nr:alpha-1,2 glucosyltransferase [Histoplasma capsulatum H143]
MEPNLTSVASMAQYKRRSRRALPALSTMLFAAILLIIWQRKIDSELPDPYLDEVFHVRQAQAYWKHRWRQWDPKITTPPGVYLCSYIIGAILFVVRLRPVHPGASFFRLGNSIVLFNILQLRLRTLIKRIRNETFSDSQNTGDSAAVNCRDRWERNLTVLNICLFPPLFFFSGLYYTDLAALLIVVEAYICDLGRTRRHDARLSPSEKFNILSWRDARFLILGLLALMFRQTNIFWVAVFLGGLQAVSTLHSMTSDCQSTDVVRIVRGSWELHQLYDPPVNEASLEDYLKTLVSLGVSTVAHIIQIIPALLPYLVFLGTFGLFVLWNGSVVLGHKEFHTAGLHLPQMLYIWPYFIFFSWPIVLTTFVTTILQRRTIELFPNVKAAAIFIPLMVLTVHLNTLVHPFTLADNRHYVFYIFRILLRHLLIKYLATPIYFVCGWAVLTTFCTPSLPPSATYTAKAGTNMLHHRTETPPAKTTKSTLTREAKGSARSPQVRLSFVLIWLIASSLSLITAPLVEPRYFLIPWVMWRLHVRLPSIPINESLDGSYYAVRCARFLYYLPLLVETAWYIVINAVTGYMFLYKGFEWPQEPGLVQRFLW